MVCWKWPYLLLPLCQLIERQRHQLGERWPATRIQGPALTHDPIPAEDSLGTQANRENELTSCRQIWLQMGNFVKSNKSRDVFDFLQGTC